MTVKLNHDALAHAEKLIERGDVVRDDRDAWSEHAPKASADNRFIEERGWERYAEWHLGIDRQHGEATKERFSFPFGDYEKVHRCAIISLESRAAQYDHDDIAKAAKRLLEKIDAKAAANR